MSFPWWADHADRSLRPIARSPCRLLKLARVRQLPAFSAELRRTGIVSAFDPELNAVEQAIIPENAESKIKQVNGTRFRLVDLYGKDLYFFLSGVSMVKCCADDPNGNRPFPT
jgi:hypothetical protein